MKELSNDELSSYLQEINAEEAAEFLGVSSAHVRTTARGKTTTNLIGGRYKVETIPLIA